MRKQNDDRSRGTIDETHRLRLAKEAFERIKPRLGSIPADRVQSLSLDLQAVSIVTRRLSKQLDRPEVRRRFEALPESYFDVADLEALRDLSLAAWHARSEAAEEVELRRVPAELQSRGRELRDRMTRVIEYHCAGDPRADAKLASMKASTGHKALANDLMRLADLYEEHREALKADVRWYRAEDESSAESIAERIVDHLERRGPSDWPEILARLWTMLSETYERIRAVGTPLFRDEPFGPKFPSLHTATRIRRYGKGVDEPEEEPAPAPPNAPTGTNDE